MKYFVFIAFAFLISCTGAQSDQYEPELVYASDQTHANLGIFITDTAYTNVREVFQDTTTTAYGLQWASENEVLFVFYQTGNTEIMSLNLETGDIKNMSNHPAKDGSPQLSPDGKLLAFTSDRDVDGRYGSGDEIYLLEIGTTDTTRITFNETYDSGIRFSPDGSQITFCRQVNREESNGEIFVYDLETKQERRVTNKPGFDCLSDFSPDAERLTFHGCSENGCDIFTISVDGESLVNITDDEFDNRWPRWSPDGDWIAYTSVRDGNSDIFIMRPDGSDKRRITTHEGRDEIAEWKPF